MPLPDLPFRLTLALYCEQTTADVMEEELDLSDPEEEVTVEKDTPETVQGNAEELEEELGYPLDPDYLAQNKQHSSLEKSSCKKKLLLGIMDTLDSTDGVVH